MTRKLALACIAALIPVLASAPATAQTLEKVTAVIPQNSVFVLSWNGAKDAGVFAKHGIDLTVDVRPFAGFLSAIPSKQAMATTYSGIDAISKMNEGLDLAIIGGGLTVIQEVFVQKDSPIKTIADLRGKRLGVWSTGAGAFKAARTAIMDAAGFDVVKDTQIVQLGPPALFKLLERGDVDAMINISSFTVQAASQPETFRSIFSVNDYWKKKTGYPLVWAAPLVAWKSWINENPDRAKNYAQAVEELLPVAEEAGKFRRRGREVRHARGGEIPGRDRRLQEMAGGEADSSSPIGTRRRSTPSGSSWSWRITSASCRRCPTRRPTPCWSRPRKASDARTERET